MCRGASPLMMVSREQLLGIRTSIYASLCFFGLADSGIGALLPSSPPACCARCCLKSIQWTWQSSRSPPVPFFCSRLQLRSSPRRTALSRTPGGSSNGIAGSAVSLSYRHCLLWLPEKAFVLVGIRQRQLLQPGPPPKSTSKQNPPAVINL